MFKVLYLRRLVFRYKNITLLMELSIGDEKRSLPLCANVAGYGKSGHICCLLANISNMVSQSQITINSDSQVSLLTHIH